MDINNTGQEAQSDQINQESEQQPIKQKGYFLPILLILLVIFIVGAGSYYFFSKKSTTQQVNNSPTTTTPETSSTKTFTLGNFTLSLPSSEIIVGSSPDQIFRSTLASRPGESTQCGHEVEGINHLSLSLRKNSLSDTKGDGFYFSATEWKLGDLKFKDSNFQQEFNKLSDELANLTDSQALTGILRQIESVNACAGSAGPSKSFSTKKVNTKKFDMAYFSEIAVGAESVTYPDRTLVINKNDDWLILHEEQKKYEYKSGDYNPYPECPIGVMRDEALKCAMNIWNTKYRNDTENEKWIQRMLDSIAHETTNQKTYTNTKHSFEFKYPSAWSLGETTDNGLKINLPNELLATYPYSMVVKWYRNYQDVEPIFKYNTQLKKWGYIQSEQPGDFEFYGGKAPGTGDFRELDKAFTTDTGIPVYCLGHEGGATHLIPISDNTFIFIQTVGIGCLHDTSYSSTPTDKVFKILKSFRLAL